MAELPFDYLDMLLFFSYYIKKETQILTSLQWNAV